MIHTRAGRTTLLALCLLALATPAAPPTSQPADPLDKSRKLADFLTHEYGGLLKKSPHDWAARSVAMIGLSRVPTAGATAKLLEQMQSDRHAVGKVVAWQAMFSRAPLLDEMHWKAFVAETIKMARLDLFAGDLRIAVLEALSATPATPDSRAYVAHLFANTSSLDSSDVPALIALGRALRAWGDELMYESMIKALAEPNTAVRAELVLKAAGADVPWTVSAESRKVYGQWWNANRTRLTASKPEKEAWRKLEPQYVPGPVKLASMDPSEKRWYKELELGAVGLKSFDFAVSIDCSRSMGGEIERLKRDLRVMYHAFGLLAAEPRIGITQFAPGDTVKTIPLTGDVKQLIAAASGIGIIGPAGEEAWAGGIERTIADSKWTAVGSGPNEHNRRVIVVISDEPITPPQRELLLPLAKRAAKEGFRLYACTIQPARNLPTDPLRVRLGRGADDDEMDDADNDDDDAGPRRRRPGFGMRRPPGGGGMGNGRAGGWAAYDEFTKLGNGSAVHARVPQGTIGLGDLPDDPAYAGVIAPIYPGGGPTARVLTRVLKDAINPQYADRVGPLVKILVAASQKAAPRTPEKRNGFASGLPAAFPEPRRGGAK